MKLRKWKCRNCKSTSVTITDAKFCNQCGGIMARDFGVWLDPFNGELPPDFWEGNEMNYEKYDMVYVPLGNIQWEPCQNFTKEMHMIRKLWPDQHRESYGYRRRLPYWKPL